MFNSKAIVLTSALLLPSCLAQSKTFTYSTSNGCSGLLSSEGHCCPGSIINAGQSSAICCAGDPNLNLINAADGVNIAINGNGINGMNIGNQLSGPSTCTAGTSTALSALPSTASGSAASKTNSASTTTVTMGSQVCVTSSDGGSTQQECHGTGEQGSSTMTASGSGNTIISGASSGGDGSSSSSSSSSPSSSSSHNAGWRPAATAAPLLAGVVAGAVALL